jgi:hypothetical protein
MTLYDVTNSGDRSYAVPYRGGSATLKAGETRQLEDVRLDHPAIPALEAAGVTIEPSGDKPKRKKPGAKSDEDAAKALQAAEEAVAAAEKQLAEATDDAAKALAETALANATAALANLKASA